MLKLNNPEKRIYVVFGGQGLITVWSSLAQIFPLQLLPLWILGKFINITKLLFWAQLEQNLSFLFHQNVISFDWSITDILLFSVIILMQPKRFLCLIFKGNLPLTSNTEIISHPFCYLHEKTFPQHVIIHVFIHNVFTNFCQHNTLFHFVWIVSFSSAFTP